MSARGLCNQELGNARMLLELGEKLGEKTPSVVAIAARQLYFCYQCFLHELAELHQLPQGKRFASAAELIVTLQQQLGANSSIEELESVERATWFQLLRQSVEPAYYLKSASPKPAREVDGNSIKVTEVTENNEEISLQRLLEVEASLIEWIVRSRELNREY